MLPPILPRVAAWLAAACIAPVMPAAAAPAVPAPDPRPCGVDAPSAPVAFERVFGDAAPAVVRVLSLRYRWLGDVDRPATMFLPMAEQAAGTASPVVERSAASGFLVTADGLVLGSAHAVQDASETWVELGDGRQFRARLVGVDERADLAALTIDGHDLPALRVAAADPRPGQWVAAIGSPFGLERSMSAGVVSAYPRELPGIAGVGLVQTDVAVNPGSSGGPLLNACGQVVGMSAMVFSSQGAYAGITFAIPARRLLQAAAALLDGARLGSAGMALQSLTPGLARAFDVPAAAGALVVEIEPGGAAAEAGVREGDVVLALDGIPTPGADALQERLDAIAPGHALRLEVWRDGARRPLGLRMHAAAGVQAGRRAAGAVSPRLGLVFADTGEMRVVGSDGAAMLAGIEEGDVIAALNGRPVAALRDFDAALAMARAAGARTVALLVVRDGVRAYVPVRVGEGAPALRTSGP